MREIAATQAVLKTPDGGTDGRSLRNFLADRQSVWASSGVSARLPKLPRQIYGPPGPDFPHFAGPKLRLPIRN